MKYSYRKHLLSQQCALQLYNNVFRIFCTIVTLERSVWLVMSTAWPVVLVAVGSPLGHIFPICTGSSRWNQSCSICGLVHGFFLKAPRGKLTFCLQIFI